MSTLLPARGGSHDIECLQVSEVWKIRYICYFKTWRVREEPTPNRFNYCILTWSILIVYTTPLVRDRDIFIMSGAPF